MIDLDHEKTRGTPFCPIMGEKCDAGRTKSMKGVKCAAWRGLPMTDRKTNLTSVVHACSLYEWPPQLGYEATAMLAQNRASVDKVANEVAKVRQSPVQIVLPAPERPALEPLPPPTAQEV